MRQKEISNLAFDKILVKKEKCVMIGLALKYQCPVIESRIET